MKAGTLGHQRTSPWGEKEEGGFEELVSLMCSLYEGSSFLRQESRATIVLLLGEAEVGFRPSST